MVAKRTFRQGPSARRPPFERSLFLVLCAVLSLAPLPARAFDPFPVEGGPGEHRRILDAALGCPAGDGAHCWTVAARDRLEPALRRPDITAITLWNPAHCDGGDLPDGRGAAALSACRDWLRAELDAAVGAADRLVDADGTPVPVRGRCGAFLAGDTDPLCRVDHHLGRALHAAQDFYAHTNWTDRPLPPTEVSLRSPQGLGGTGPIPWLAADDAGSPPAGLMSGCFLFFPEGLFCQGRTRHEDLNKDRRHGSDTPPVGGTPRGEVGGNFARAFDAAAGETARMWTDLEARLVATHGGARGRAMACVLRTGSAASCAPAISIRPRQTPG